MTNVITFLTNANNKLKKVINNFKLYYATKYP